MILALEILGLVIVTYFLLRPKKRSEWPHEGAVCSCTHGYYDHDHDFPIAPCAALMCSCYRWNPTKETE